MAARGTFSKRRVLSGIRPGNHNMICLALMAIKSFKADLGHILIKSLAKPPKPAG
jgi:hypothetical protein